MSTPEVHIIEKSQPSYPAKIISALGKGAPDRLSLMGNVGLLELPSVGFCGSRKASEKGLETADDCAEQAAACGVVVVSGNAAGVDLKAHFSALKNGGSTILVLPEGINHFRIRKALREVWSWDRVLVVSQFGPEIPWRAYHAMARNKMIIALSGAMVVIEAGETGGTLDAGRATLDIGLPLFVAQYEVAKEGAKGNRILLSDGGNALNRRRSTQRANMDKVWHAFFHPQEYAAQQKLI